MSQTQMNQQRVRKNDSINGYRLEQADRLSQKRKKEREERQQRNQRDISLGFQNDQSITSHMKRDGEITHGIKNFFGKSGTPVSDEGAVRSIRNAADYKSRKGDTEFNARLDADLMDLQGSELAEDIRVYAQLNQLKNAIQGGLGGENGALAQEVDNMLKLRGELTDLALIQELDYYIGYFRGTLNVPETVTPGLHPDLTAEKIDATQTGVALDEKYSKRTDGKIVTIAKKYQNVPLFPSTPNIQDVNQGNLGDCFFMASIDSILNSDPQQIKNMMRDNGDNTVTFRFFRERQYQQEYNWIQDKEEFQNMETGITANRDAFKSMSPEARLEFLLRKVRWEDESKRSNFSRNIQNILPSQWYMVKYNGHSLFELLMDQKFCDSLADDDMDPYCGMYSELGVYRDIAKNADNLQDALQMMDNLKHTETDSFIAFAMTVIKKSGNSNLELEDKEAALQEIYVTVTKDLPEEALKHDWHGNVTKTEAIYANGPLYIRLLEKAYAASGLNQTLKEGNYGKELLDLDRSYQGIKSGQLSKALLHLTGQRFKEKGMIDIRRNTLMDAVTSYFIGNGNWKRDILKKTTGFVDKDMNDLEEALEEEDRLRTKSVTQTDNNGHKITTEYREQAAGLDDLVRVILSSKIEALNGDSAEERKKRLAQQMTDLMAGDRQNMRPKLQYASFSGKYTESAKDILQQIRDSLAHHKPVGAASASFIPEAVNSSGLNGEAISGGIVEKHGYSVVGTVSRDNLEFIVLRNPWASGHNVYRRLENGTVTDELERSTENNGIFLVELNDFMRRFQSITYGV